MKDLQNPRSALLVSSAQSRPNLSEKIPKKPTLSTGRQPKGSRIVLNKTSRRLVVKIPPLGWQAAVMWVIASLICFCMALGFRFVIVEAVIRGQIQFFSMPFLIFLFVSIMGGLSGLDMLRQAVYALVGSSYLEIDSSSFRLGWKCLCFSGQVRGRTADIWRIEGGANSTPVIWENRLNLDEKARQIEFAAEVTPPEQEWLVAEVSDFLEHLSIQKS